MIVPRSAALLAGEVLAHAAGSISESPEGEILTPLAGYLQGGKVELLRFVPEGDLSGTFIAFARQQLVDQHDTVEAWTLSYDARVPLGGTKVDAIVFEVWGKGMSDPEVFAQPYQPFSSGDFKLLGPPLSMGEETPEAQHGLPETLAAFREGVGNHRQVAPLWDSWLQAGPPSPEAAGTRKPWWRLW